jgi:hypothetical protein
VLVNAGGAEVLRSGRRALGGLLVGLVVACAAAAPAMARPSLAIQGLAISSYGGGFEQTRLTVECAAVDVKNANFGLTQCSVGPVYADVSGCFECPGKAVAYATGIAVLGPLYQLCVAASSWGAAGHQFLSKCVPLDPLTGTAVLVG